MKKIVLSSLVASSILMAGGYKIPEVSLNAVALGAANIAHNKSADAAYYNPANMVFMQDSNYIESDVTYIGLDSIDYKGTDSKTGSTQNNISSESETFIVPSLHYVSGKAGETRIGLSIVAPGGLSKRWTDQPAESSAKEFTISNEEYETFKDYVLEQEFEYSTSSEEMLEKMKKTAEEEGYFEDIQEDYNKMLEKVTPSKERDLEKFKEQIISFLDNEIISRYYFQDGRAVQSFKNDLFIESSLEILQNTSKYNTILGK